MDGSDVGSEAGRVCVFWHRNDNFDIVGGAAALELGFGLYWKIDVLAGITYMPRVCPPSAYIPSESQSAIPPSTPPKSTASPACSNGSS